MNFEGVIAYHSLDHVPSFLTVNVKITKIKENKNKKNNCY